MHDETFGPISLEEVTIQTVGEESRTGRLPVFATNPTAVILSAMVAVFLVIGGITFLMTGSNEADPVDQPSTLLPPPSVLRQGAEIITYTSDPRSSGDLIAQDPETGERRTLVSADELGGRLVGWAAWSADGRWAAFEILGCPRGSAEVSGIDGGLWVTDGLDESRQLTRPCSEDPDAYTELWEWSPTDTQLVVASQFSDGDGLILIDPATGDRKDLGKTAGDVTSLAWSPDGRGIAYGAVPTGTPDANSDQGSLHLVSVDGGEHSLLASSLGTVSGNETGSGVRWSPDGERIAVLAEGAENSLYLMDADGSDLQLIAEGVVIEHTLGSPGLMWSPDGTRIAYATFSGGRQKLQIWNGSLDGSTPILVFDSPRTPGEGIGLAGGPVWSPDGTSIAFRYSPTEQEIWMVANADGSGDAREIDELEYMSWRGGWYFCECYG
jgi:Tol biopolymer transport system component